MFEECWQFHSSFERKEEIVEQYKNLGGNSSVRAFTIGDDYIEVRFNGGSVYRYSYRSAGSDKIEQMKKLARQGRGLNSFIMRYVKMSYER